MLHCFANLINYSVFGEDLIDDKFERWDQGPVLSCINQGHCYGSLRSIPKEEVVIEDRDDDLIANITSIVYGNKSARDLSEESHSHNIWKNKGRNETIDFSAMDESLKKYMNNIFDLYKDMDFNNLVFEQINGNKYYYFKDNLEMTEDFISQLSQIEANDDIVFIEQIGNDLVFS